jgi:hypothetical protein
LAADVGVGEDDDCEVKVVAVVGFIFDDVCDSKEDSIIGILIIPAIGTFLGSFDGSEFPTRIENNLVAKDSSNVETLVKPD